MNFKKYTLVSIHHLLINSPKYQEKKRNNVINKCNKRSSDPISQFKAVMNYLIKRVCKRFSWGFFRIPKKLCDTYERKFVNKYGTHKNCSGEHF